MEIEETREIYLEMKKECDKTASLDYQAYYDKHMEEIAYLKMQLADMEEHNRILREDVLRLNAIKATVEVIFGRKFDGN